MEPQKPSLADDLASSNSVVQAQQAHVVARTGAIAYLVAIALGLFSGWVNQVVTDPLLTALCVVSFTMFLGTWKKQQPWRWMLLVWIGVPLMLAYYHFVAHLPHTRGEVYGAFLQLLAGSAGAHGGHFMREMVDHVFLKQDD